MGAGKGGRRHLAVHPGEARAREVAVEASFNELLRRGLEKLGEQAAAARGVVLVRHHDRELVRARLFDLLAQPLVRPRFLVEVKEHVCRLLRSVGGRDGEAGKGRGELVCQPLCARVGRRGPHAHLLGKVTRVSARAGVAGAPVAGRRAPAWQRRTTGSAARPARRAGGRPSARRRASRGAAPSTSGDGLLDREGLRSHRGLVLPRR